MGKYQFTDEAAEDIKNIRQFTAQHWGGAQAKRYLQQIKKTLEHLAENPLLGTRREEDLGTGIFSHPCQRHVLFYTYKPDLLTVLTVLHHSQTPRRLLPLRLRYPLFAPLRPPR